MSFAEATRQRRTIRGLLPKSPISDGTIVQIAEDAIRHVPSAFNSQTTRLTVLLHEEHLKLWSIIARTLRGKLGEERWNEGTQHRISGFEHAYGTILFWDDSKAANATAEDSPDIYKDKMAEWVHQSNGMHQYFLWTALEALGLGVNLQHYNPLIDEEVSKTWNIPVGWILGAQMVFGMPKDGSAPAQKEQKVSMEERVTRFGVREAQDKL